MEEVRIELKHYLTCLWPGMAELWWRGRMSALPAAIAFTAVVNSLLIARYLYADWLSGALVMLACWVVFAAWLVLTVRAIKDLPYLLSPREVSEEPDLFPEAQLAYLRGEYALAEKALTSCLNVEPRDPPALLMLAAVYRHTGRTTACDVLLTEIGKLEVADHWNLEYSAEVARLERDLEARDDASSDQEDNDEEVTDENASQQFVTPEQEEPPTAQAA